MAWQNTVLSKGDGLLITAGEREGKGGGRTTGKPRRACSETDREKAAQCILKLGFPVLSAFYSTALCSSLPEHSYQGFSLTPTFPRELSVLWNSGFHSQAKLQLPFLCDNLPPPADYIRHRPNSHTANEAAHTGSAQLRPGPLASFLPLSNLRTPLPLPLQQHRTG